MQIYLLSSIVTYLLTRTDLLVELVIDAVDTDKFVRLLSEFVYLLQRNVVHLILSVKLLLSAFQCTGIMMA